MKKYNGFTAIEGLLLLVIVGIIGFTGWYVWQQKQIADNTIDTASQISQSTPVKHQTKDSHGRTLCSYFQDVYCIQKDGSKIKMTKVEASSRQESWNMLPSDLQQFILSVWPKSCLEKNMGPNSPVYSGENVWLNGDGKFAEAPVGCDGGAVYLFAKIGGEWKNIESTQFGFSCSTYDKYKVPESYVAGPDGGYPDCQESAGAAIY